MMRAMVLAACLLAAARTYSGPSISAMKVS